MATGRIYFWGDLTYLHFPWKTFVAQLLQAGHFPHWNPYAYLGMPLHGNFQTAVLYPGSLPFYLLTFEQALCLFLPLHFFLGGFFGFLWLRKSGARRTPALVASTAFILGGIWIAHLPFLNHVGALTWLPAMLLMTPPLLFGTVLAFSLLNGYPTMTAGSVVAVAAMRSLSVHPRWRSLAGGILVGLVLYRLLRPLLSRLI